MSDPSPTILIIDNDGGMVAAISTRLESMGYRCVTAGTGGQGIAIFREQTIDLVITDLNMPAGDGITLTRTLRETSEVPIIIITGFHDDVRSRGGGRKQVPCMGQRNGHGASASDGERGTGPIALSRRYDPDRISRHRGYGSILLCMVTHG